MKTKMNVNELAYLAGLFDGEGSIMIVKRNRNANTQNPTFHLQVKLALVQEWLVRWIQFHYGGYVYRRIRPNPKHRDVYCWQLDQHQSLQFLNDIKDYLLLKRGQAELAIKFQMAKKIGRPRTPKGQFINAKDDNSLAVQEAQYILMRSMKH